MRFTPPSNFLRRNNPLLYTLPLPATAAAAAAAAAAAYCFATMSTSSPTPPNPSTGSTTPPFPTRPYTSPHQTFPYQPSDFTRADESSDEDFYSAPRFVTHIDDHAIGVLKRYYAGELPSRGGGRILDLCSSWISHFPRELEERVAAAAAAAAAAGGGGGEATNAEGGDEEGRLEVIGLGMNKAELDANALLGERVLQNLNVKPGIPEGRLAPLDATVCVVSVDYLTSPVEVLASVYRATRVGGRVHLVISNRCFPTKAVGRWLRVGEQERLNMVGEYLWWSGWRGVEIVELCDGSVEEEGKGEDGDGGGGLKGGMAELMRSMGMGGGRVDPLWVVRGTKMEERRKGGEVEKSEL